MACVGKMPKVPMESEMEEGEILDELDYLSDISSEEEFLMRQRLEVLEDYNTVLERKEAKQSSMGPGTKPKRDVICDLSEVSAAELEDPHTHVTYKQLKIQTHVKPYNKQKRKKTDQYVDENNMRRRKNYQSKKYTRKKRLALKVISESSDESEDEYRNKRKKLADAVILPRGKSGKTSLSARLHKMIHGSEVHINEYRNKRKKLADAVILPQGESGKSSLRARLHKMIHGSQAHINFEYKDTNTVVTNKQNALIEQGALSPISSVNTDDPILCVDVPDGVSKDKNKTLCELIVVSTDDDVNVDNTIEIEGKTKSDGSVKNDAKQSQENLEIDSDEDVEQLRERALKSKHAKLKEPKEDLSDEENELRLICLRSSKSKRAIRRKLRKKRRQNPSKYSNLADKLFYDQESLSRSTDSDNNTDIESVDMDMGSDADDKMKGINVENDKLINTRLIKHQDKSLINCGIDNLNAIPEEDEMEDDEDLLRAKLLTEMGNNMSNLAEPQILYTMDEVERPVPQPVPGDDKTNKFIIKLGESDSEEHEATKNLTEMHMKLSEQIDFQQKLDRFLKSTRMEVEKTNLPDIIQKPPLPKKPEKFVAKVVNHLPKSEQIEYKFLVQRMAELEKIKRIRQASINKLKLPLQIKDMLKQRNVTIQGVNKNVEEQIAKSRKTIAEESVKMLKLKEEATKLSQRYKIAATELRNITTAITFNQKQQRTIQNRLSKIRLQHQTLLKSSATSLHSKVNGCIPPLKHLTNKLVSNTLQKENNPEEEYRNPQVQKTVTISVINDFVDKDTIANPRMSVQLDVTNNTKVVKIPEDPVTNIIAEVKQDVEKEVMQTEDQDTRLSDNNNDLGLPEVEKENTDDTELVAVCDHGNTRYYISVDDYKSPLDALGTNTWQADPNAILCRFQVGGQCKDPDCKYLHTSTRKH